VSIGLPVYNGAGRVGDALRSALSQDYQQLEIIVSDNASEDETGLICRRVADSDPRVRYLRNPTNIGLVPNFSRVRDEAGGQYFCWLTHDDLLSEPTYVSSVVDYLESHRDVVCCHTSARIISDPLLGYPPVVEFPELAPDRRWEDARRDLFRWPRPWLELASQGMFRREDLATIPIPERGRLGRPHIFCWEIDMLTALSLRGRIVALPQALRTYRTSPGSAAHRMGRTVSSFDLLLIGVETRLTLIGRALRASGSLRDRRRLVAAALSNFFRPAFRRRFDHRHFRRLAKRELAGVLRVADERAELLESLQAEVKSRDEILRARGIETHSERVQPAPVKSLRVDIDRSLRTTRGVGYVTDFFRPPSEWQLRRLDELDANVSAVRALCEAQLREIEDLHEEAARLLREIEVSTQGRSTSD